MIPAYHVGPYGCRGIAFYLVRRPMLGEGLNSSIVRMPDGTTPSIHSAVTCGACGKDVGADHVARTLDLSLADPEAAPRPRLTLLPSAAGLNGKAKRPKNLRKLRLVT